jgi:Zn-finger nucleic acid-binding protein
MPVEASSLRFLVACTGCRRQYDAAALAPGSRFHCACGAAVEVPRRRVFDADVVRCSSCSAPRRHGAESCDHCGADFTLHERDLQTICPQCMTRISNRARFCHRCATPILPQGQAGEPTDRECPACGEASKKLSSRELGREVSISVLECGSCAGIWLSRESFEILAERARGAAPDEEIAGFGVATSSSRRSAPRQRGPLYRRCPECRQMMHRRNFGRRSGVVIDTCKDHGIWFDAEELERILRWIREGGEARTRRRAAEEQAARSSAVNRFMSDRLDRLAGQGRSFDARDSRFGRDDTIGRIFAQLFDF